MKTFGQVLTAMITPFTDTGEVDYQGAVFLANYLLDNGSDGLVVCGTTGESPTLTTDEKLKLFTIIAKECSHRGPIIANTGSYNTRESVELTEEVSKIKGISGIMAVVPYYNKPNQEGCFRHFKAIAEATTLPVMVYNVPGRTSSSITVDTLLRLVQSCPNIKALKDAAGNPAQTGEAALLLPKDFMIYSGDDGLTLPMLAVGACGVISVIAHVAGREMKDMITAYERGDIETAKSIHLSLQPLLKAMFITTNPIPVKTAMMIMNLPAGGFRLPLVEATAQEHEFIANTLRAFNKIK